MTAAAFGTWRSPLSAAAVARGAVRMSSVAIDGSDIYWIESRPDEGGRQIIVRRDATGRIADVTPPGASARSRVHEYGGGAYLVDHGVVYYCEQADQRVYRLAPGEPHAPLTPAGPWRYADGHRHPVLPVMVCVREDQSVPGSEPANTIVVLPLDPSAPSAGVEAVSGADFYAYPRFSPDGRRLSWIEWRHPQMPWDGTELWMADVDTRGGGIQLFNRRRLAGGPAESIVEPGWVDDCTLYYVSDRSGWWNLYRARLGSVASELPQAGTAIVEAVCPIDAECGGPLWQLGASTWAPVNSTTLAVSYAARGRRRLATVDTATGTLTDLDLDVMPGFALTATATHAVFVGQSPTVQEAIVRVELATGSLERLSAPPAWTVDPRYLSCSRPIEFDSTDGARVHALFYAPVNGDYEAPDTERPPLIVVAHGGPTSAASAAFNPVLQFWTSRGFAVVDVDYRGSTGYGRAYRERLNGNWGVIDVGDCISAARHLIDCGQADPLRTIVKGRSAGGYTALAALTFHPGVFPVGASYYGVSDLEALARDTHKFESRYLDALVGPWPAMRDRYVERSPIHAVDRLASAIILFQGREDRVVPAAQSEVMAAAARANGLPVSLVVFDDEQHGFRKADTIRRSLEAELYFYGVVFGFTPADDLPPIQIHNGP